MKSRYFTTKEVAQMAGCGVYSVRNIAMRLGIEYEVRPTSNSRAAYYSYLDTQKIIEVVKRYKPVEKVKKELVVSDEMEEDHPLVIDKRCLKLSWWPEVVPKCFEDLDD